MKRQINWGLALFFLLQVVWGVLYFNNYLPKFPVWLTRLFWLGTAIGSIITGLFAIKVKGSVVLSTMLMILGLLMIMFWILGFLITRMLDEI